MKTIQLKQPLRGDESDLYKTDGIVLRTRNLGEADKIVTVYTKTKGKIAAVARGARRIRNRLLSSTQVFTYGRYLIFEGKSLDTLSQGEIIFSYQSLRDDLEKMAAAMYVCELIDVFLEVGEANGATFSSLRNTLKLIDQGQIDKALRGFELKFVQQQGYEPQLTACINCGSFVEGAGAVYFSREGGVVCSNCKTKFTPLQRLNKGTVELIKRILQWDWPRLGVLQPSAQNLSEIEKCMREYLDYRLEKPMRSIDFMRTLKEFSQPGGEINGDRFIK